MISSCPSVKLWFVYYLHHITNFLSKIMFQLKMLSDINTSFGSSMFFTHVFSPSWPFWWFIISETGLKLWTCNPHHGLPVQCICSSSCRTVSEIRAHLFLYYSHGSSKAGSQLCEYLFQVLNIYPLKGG